MKPIENSNTARSNRRNTNGVNSKNVAIVAVDYDQCLQKATHVEENYYRDFLLPLLVNAIKYKVRNKREIHLFSYSNRLTDFYNQSVQPAPVNPDLPSNMNSVMNTSKGLIYKRPNIHALRILRDALQIEMPEKKISVHSNYVLTANEIKEYFNYFLNSLSPGVSNINLSSNFLNIERKIPMKLYKQFMGTDVLKKAMVKKLISTYPDCMCIFIDDKEKNLDFVSQYSTNAYALLFHGTHIKTGTQVPQWIG